MITYNPKDWFTFIFRIHRSETFRQLIPLMLGISVYSALVAWLEIHIFLSKDTVEIARGVSSIYSILGFTLSLLLVFRTNTGYDRWWEGRRLWGELTNANRAFAAQVGAILGKNHLQQRQTLAALLAVYAETLHFHLRPGRLDTSYYQQQLKDTEAATQADYFAHAPHQPLAIYGQLLVYLQQQFEAGRLNTQEIYHFKSETHKLMDVCGGCERIKNTPIPFSYSAFLKKFIFLYVMLFPIIFCVQMSYYVIPVTAFVLYVLASLELLAEEIENPFNGDANDLPTFELSQNIARQVRSLLLPERN